MIVECPKCEAKVDAKVTAEHEYVGNDTVGAYKVSFLLCTVCDMAILAGSEEIQIGPEKWAWSKPTRLWPSPPEYFNSSIPRMARQSLAEAKQCFQAGAYSACAVMCGRAIEAICAEYGTSKTTLSPGLKELKDKKIIEDRLYAWGKALEKERNIGAHVSEEVTTRQDARDVLDFATAICEYIFVLSEKYEKFMERKATARLKKQIPPRLRKPTKQ